jgi:hypothetical protein
MHLISTRYHLHIIMHNNSITLCNHSITSCSIIKYLSTTYREEIELDIEVEYKVEEDLEEAEVQ